MNFSYRLRCWFTLVILLAVLVQIFPAAPVQAESAHLPVQSVNAAPWLDAQESAGIIYLLIAAPVSIKRYQISTQSWLSDIVLSATPTAFRVTADALYIAFARRAAKFQLDGTGETHLLNTTSDILSLHVANQLLLINISSGLTGNFISFDLASKTIVDNKSYYPYSLVGVSLAPGIGKLFGRTIGISPSDIFQLQFSPQGMFILGSDSPYHGAYPDASRTWVSPDEKTVIDSSGMVYNTADLTYRNSLAGQVNALAYYGDLPIVLRGGTLIAFSNIFMETGRATPNNPPQHIFVSGETIYAFYFDGQAPQVEKIPVKTLHPAVPGAPVDPNGLAFTPDKVVIGKDETVYLLSKKYQSIFRWSVAQRRYLSTIPLLDVPSTIAYAPNENRLYVAYPNDSIYQIRLNESLLEIAFANLPGPACGLAVAGSFVFTCDPTGAWGTHSIFSPAGVMLSKKDWNYYSSEYIWNAARQKMYFFRDSMSPNDILWENIDANGLIGTLMDSPYHGSAGIAHPMRVKQDGSIVLLGSGWMYDGLTLVQNNTLSNTINDADWKGDSLVTLRAYNNASELQKWMPVSYGIVKAQAVSGSPLNLFSVQEGWLVITNQAGLTRFTIWSEDFAPVSTPPLADFSATPTAGDVPVEVHFSNLSSEGLYSSSLWEFGDGSTSTETNPIHLYTQSGSYSVKLTVSGPGGSGSLVKTNAIQVRPVTANFSSSRTRGEAPLNVQFTNQTTGQVNSYLWDFGDGTTSTEKDPAHTFSNPGNYTVTLTVDGLYGGGSIEKKNLIQAYNLTYHYVPIFTRAAPVPFILPGKYEFSNLCQQFPMYLYGSYMGQMRECVPSVEVKENGVMYFNYSWTYYASPNVTGCLVKYSDAGNRNMYIKNSAGNRYDHTEVDGNGYIDCMQSGTTYPGWFKFPAAQTKNTIFTFYDDDAWIRITPVILRAVP